MGVGNKVSSRSPGFKLMILLLSIPSVGVTDMHHHTWI